MLDCADNGRDVRYLAAVDIASLAVATGGDNPWAANKDLLALAVSLVALIVSVVTARQNVKATREIAQDAAKHAEGLARTAAYQRMHELLVDPKAACGRRKLFQAAKTGAFPSPGDQDWDDINYSLALYDTLGGYVSRGQVDRSVVLDAWHHPLANISGPVRRFVDYRVERGINQPWAHLIQLLSMGEKYPCACPGTASQESSLNQPTDVTGPPDPRA